MSTSTRRGLLGGAAVLAAGPAVAAEGITVTVMLPANPDAELITVCAAFDALERAYVAQGGDWPFGSPEEDAAEVERERVAAAQEPLVARMCELRAVTREGQAARARSLALWDAELMKPDELRPQTGKRQDTREAVRQASPAPAARPDVRTGAVDPARAYWGQVADGSAQTMAAQPSAAKATAGQRGSAQGWLIAPYADPSGRGRDSLGRAAPALARSRPWWRPTKRCSASAKRAGSICKAPTVTRTLPGRRWTSW